MSHYDLLLQKLDAFIRKYYANQLMRGGLIFLACVLLYLLLITVGEYFFFFSIQVKWTLLGFFFSVGLLALIVWVLIPFFKMKQLGKIISHEQAAVIVGNFFPEVKDKLLNVLQLKHQTGNASESEELVAASIDQRAAKISILPFGSAIDLGKNKKYLPLLGLPLLIALGVFLIAPKIFTEGGYRLSQPSVFFAKPAPFTFKLINKNLNVIEGQAFTLIAAVAGDKLPERLFVVLGSEQVEMQASGKNKFTYTFPKVTQDITFRLTAADYYSEAYQLKVFHKPEIQSMRMTLNYPAYTGKKSETLQGLSDVSVPVGTTLAWQLETKHTDEIQVIAGNVNQLLAQNGQRFSSAIRFMSAMPYLLILKNKQQGRVDTLQYQVQTIEDQYPQVSINVNKDTTLAQQILITGTAGDDYEVRQTLFVYQILNAENKILSTKSVPLKSGGQVVAFSHYFDIGTLKLAPGYQVNYFVEAWDNDCVNGSKSSKSTVMSWKAPNLTQLDKSMAENAEKMNASMSSSAAQSEQLKEELQNMQKEMLESGESSWERTQKMQSVLDKNLQLKTNLENLKKRFEEQQKQSEAKNFSEDIKEKQASIKEQIDNLKDKQLEEQIKKLQELLQKKDQRDALNQFQQMEQNNKLFKMDMERMQELMKKLEMQMNMEALAQKLDELSKREGALQKETEAGEKANDALKKEQEKIKDALDKALQNELKEITKQNEQLEQPQKLDKAQEQGKEAGEEMDKSSQQLQQNDKSKAKQSQQNAKNKLAEMSKSLMDMAGGMDMEQLDIDIKATRQLLTNLIRFSFDQENLMKLVRTTSINSPSYLLLTKEQNRLKNNTKMIKDSLYTLSKRIFKIAATVNKETSDLDQNIARTLDAFEQRNIGEILPRQQYAMTAANNLALLLNELLSNLMQSQQGGASGSGGQSKPKKGKGQGQGQGSGSGMMKDIITGQQQMGQGMQQMKQGQQPGGQQGQGQSGQGQSGQGQNGQGQGQNGQQNGGSQGTAEQIARLAQQQAMLRKQMQELIDVLNSKGMGGKVTNEIRAIQAALDKQETDLVFRRNIDELIQRNKEILTRMLEAEKAIQEQEEDNKRSAEAGKDAPRPMPAELSDYLKRQQQLFEQYRTTVPVLKPFYQKMAEEYLRKVQGK
ncbi:hypothetical protein DBR32_06500 [Taibaiella sp. KBW10]|uniref:DUF4175 family protein n=1 Tax=Taibaiella sp. KBW10 TaxID=2153357 RepID=UPI000F599B51|nr:hypothetical protein [Taibaiella sp. KBW10]RQO31600.1 hypothetical protein DBR32_06500 [Taibaiella sp. KBW10]